MRRRASGRAYSPISFECRTVVRVAGLEHPIGGQLVVRPASDSPGVLEAQGHIRAESAQVHAYPAHCAPVFPSRAYEQRKLVGRNPIGRDANVLREGKLHIEVRVGAGRATSTSATLEVDLRLVAPSRSPSPKKDDGNKVRGDGVATRLK